MRYLVFIFLSLYIISITGCSAKQESIKDEIVISKQENTNEEEVFLNEFEEEMEVSEISDPFSGYNRAMTNFNDKVYEYVITPVSNGYKFAIHKEIRVSVHNFFHNIGYPIRLMNNLLQGKVLNSVDETGRFIINSTVGVLGLFDPAKSYFNIEKHNEDFGQTLGYYGVGGGPHIVLPFFGPSNLRDLVGRYPDFLVNPVEYRDERSYNLTSDYSESLLVGGYDRINSISLNNQYEKIKKDAIDLYPYLRDMYEQYRVKQIKE